MFILAIDTSCDETSVSISWDDVILSNVISSQVELHKKYGGVVPMIAMRAHKERIDAVIEEAVRRARSQISNFKFLISKQFPKPKSKTSNRTLSSEIHDSRFTIHNVDVFAVTYGPGLAPALQVGIEKAKELSKRYKRPLVAVDHMEGHIYSNFAKRNGVNYKLQIKNYKQIQNSKSQIKNRQTFSLSNVYTFPLLCLLISGGHTELVLMKNHGQYEVVGETLDDAVGEAFDKVAKMLNLGYPGGPIVENLAREGNPLKYDFPIPLAKSKTNDFSYSGLKTSVLYKLQKISQKGVYAKKQICDVCASFQRAAIEHLVQKTKLAVEKILLPERSKAKSKDYTNETLRQAQRIKYLLLGGGVVANQLVRKELRKVMRPHHIKLVYPTDHKLLGDNAAMIAVVAFHKAKRKEFVKNIHKLDRNPGLRIAK